MPVILATQEVEIRRIVVQKPAQANSQRDSISKKCISQKRAGGMVQGVGPEFKPKYHIPTHKKMKAQYTLGSLL
jgi:hypothetical protein